MPPYRLILEDHRNVFPATLVNVEAAIRKLANSTGPTFLNLKDEGGNWAQAGGTDGRYRVEVRDIYGEGFQYWMDDEVAEKGLSIKVIKPKGDKGNRT